MDKYSYIANAHGDYIDELYAQYQQNPQSVDESWQKFFEGFEFSSHYQNEETPSPDFQQKVGADTNTDSHAYKEICVRNLIYAFRTRAHLKTKTNPVRERRYWKAYLDPTEFGLTDADGETTFEAGKEIGLENGTLNQIIDKLKAIYSHHIGFEFMYIREPEIQQWFKDTVEDYAIHKSFDYDQKCHILGKLNEAVVFENFLHTKYIGQKRFSLEGGETTIPALDAMIHHGAALGAEEFVIGMAHRGRLNVLANIMGKTYEQIFNEFEGNTPSDSTMGDGDVKYHLGYSSDIVARTGEKVKLNLTPNPSHLEAVNPVVQGNTRAKIDYLYENDYHKIVPVLIHGDAAIAGQGIMYEITQMAKLHGFNTGGTIHFVINNQIGFTTNYHDARSSIYCTDIAKVTDCPVMHVNGDDPEAVVHAMEIAIEYRQKFNRDVYIDMVCYRRHGHNESDEPKFTQPQLYKKIAKHPNPREVYSKYLSERGEMDAKVAQEMDKQFRQLLQDRLNLVKQSPLPYKLQPLERQWQALRKSKGEDFDYSPITGIDELKINQVATALTTVPEGFKVLRQIEKLIKERKNMFFEEQKLNWAAGELLAYGSMLIEGKKVRLTGQDVIRGTFSHRHAALFDSETNEKYNSLNHIDEKQEHFSNYNSLLSEYAVLGFEYGYSTANPNALTIWEAQFGDFANGAQVMIDQFICSSETKWNSMSALVMLLPHGYEGQGPEHSSARLERFLQISANQNWIITNITTPANFFHAMRRQLTWDFRKPLVNMSPKSLLRHPEVVSPISDFTEKTSFQEIIDDPKAGPRKTKRVVFCSGKVYYDLLEKQRNDKREDVALVRVEQIHPFPTKQVEDLLDKYKKAEVVWVQEEPKNMGAWWFIRENFPESRNIRCISRNTSTSPATGYAKLHAKNQAIIVETTFDLK
ncbi:2-oxoglutarate dehydrogenase E1 component [Persicobacter psychrovividus]|uniref:oxoglutarate dehydrogenase (succinyl-transferring) n=1 Tax=Persicobacter psychrovividus TaxID=387638 RepID=A0ABM7VA99_9BACT|nr:2-oxoglutarate dehydrogenase subunit E1 [Persicobacter psychrovividus]